MNDVVRIGPIILVDEIKIVTVFLFTIILADEIEIVIVFLFII